MCIKTSKKKKVTYSLICVLCFCLVVFLCFQCFQCVQNLFVKNKEFKRSQGTSFYVIQTIQVFNRSHQTRFCSYSSMYFYQFSETTVIKIILIFNWVLINQFLLIQYFYWFIGTNISIGETFFFANTKTQISE